MHRQPGYGGILMSETDGGGLHESPSLGVVLGRRDRTRDPLDAGQRLEFLIRAGDVLAGDLGRYEVLERIACLVVPRIADACWVDLLAGPGELARTGFIAPNVVGVGPLGLVVAAHDGRADGLVGDLACGGRVRLEQAPLVAAILRAPEPWILTPLRGCVGGLADLAGPVPIALPARAQFHLGVRLQAGALPLGVLSLLYLDADSPPGPDGLAAAADLACLVGRAMLGASRSHRQRRLQSASRALAASLGYAELEQVVVNELLSASEADAIMLGLVQPDGDTIRLVVSSDVPDDLLPALVDHPVSAREPIAEAVRTEKVVSFDSPGQRARRWPGLDPASPASHFAAFVCLPISSGGRTAGILGLGWSQVRSLDGEEAAALVELGAQCGFALGRAEIYQARSSALRRSGVLVALGEALDGPFELTPILERVAGIVPHWLGDWCCIHLLRSAAHPGSSPRTDSLELAALAHRDPTRTTILRRLAHQLPSTLVDSQGAGAVVRENRADIFGELSEEVLIGAAGTPEQIQDLRSLDLTTCAGVSVPLRRGEMPVGALTVVWDRPGALGSASGGVGSEEVDLVCEVGRRVAMALNAVREVAERRAAEEAQAEMVARSARLQRVTSALAGLMAVEEVGRTVLNHAMVAMGAIGGALSLYNEGTGTFRNVRIEGLGLASGVSWPATEVKGRVLRRLVLRGGRPIFVSSSVELHQIVPHREAEALRESIGDLAMATLPLMSGGSPLGTLLLTFPTGHAFTEPEREYLSELAIQTTQALERSLRYQLEHQVAQSLQRALLPERIPKVSGLAIAVRYLPASDTISVGGDFYDVLELPGDRIALVVGDVVGHDLQAAGLMGRIRAQLMACVYQQPSPGEALYALNRLIVSHDEDAMATIALVLWDRAAGSISLSLAGHPPPLLIDPTPGVDALSRCRFVQVETGPPIGAANPAQRFAEATYPVAAGNSLVMFTDGLVERRDVALERRLEELRVVVANCDGAALAPELAPQPDDVWGPSSRLVEDLVGEVTRQMMGEGHRNDDVAVLAAHFHTQS